LGRLVVPRAHAGVRWTSGALSFAVLHPAASDYDGKRSTNAMSCVVRISLGALHLLLTGDIALADEAALLVREPALRADWLEAPHHGSRTSSSAQLLDALGATAAVAQAGYRNRFRHPSEEVVARYRARNIELLRTDHLGAVQWRFAGKPAIVAAARRTDARYWHNRPDSSARAAAEADPAPELELPDASSGPPEPLIGGFGS
jgi:competence protein ComEC